MIDVLKPALKRVGNSIGVPDSKRWRCTLELSHDFPDIKKRSLDTLLKHFELQPRDKNDKHCARIDAELCGKLYMKMMDQLRRQL